MKTLFHMTENQKKKKFNNWVAHKYKKSAIKSLWDYETLVLVLIGIYSCQKLFLVFLHKKTINEDR